jgi:hypothetical protein
MARVLELVDESGDKPRPTGDEASLDQNGKVSYKGNGVRVIIGQYLVNHSADEVFDKMAGWSNGYSTLREKGS